MPITQEYLLSERTRLQQRHAQLVADANATAGALELLTALLSKIEEPTTPADTDTKEANA